MHLAVAARNAPVHAALDRVRVPAFGIWGVEDLLLGDATPQRLAHVVPVVRLEGAGHMPQLEAPTDVASEIETRLEQWSA